MKVKYIYDEESSLHKEITFEDYLKLDEADRKNNNIYFIKDIDSEMDLINKLNEKMQILQQKLEEVIANGRSDA